MLQNLIILFINRCKDYKMINSNLLALAKLTPENPFRHETITAFLHSCS